MATRELTSGPVDSFDYIDNPVFLPAVVVGDPPQWGDESDDTYAEAVGATTTTDPSIPYAEFEAVPDATLVNSLTVEGRYKTAYPSGTFPTAPPRHFSYTFRTDRLYDTPEAWSVSTLNVGHPEAVNDNAIHNFSFQAFPAPWMTPEDVAVYEPAFRELLTAGPLVLMRAGSQRLSVTRPSTLTVYELRLIVDYEADTNRKLRLYPRDDVLGFGGVRRQYPPPRRARNYGNQP